MATSMTMFVPLSLTEWCPVPNGGKGYFKCRALGISGVQVVRLWSDGEEPLSPDYYEVRGKRLYWKGGVPPARLDVEVIMRRPLRAAREVLLAAMLGLLIGGYLMARHSTELQSVAQRVQSIASIASDSNMSSDLPAS